MIYTNPISFAPPCPLLTETTACLQTADHYADRKDPKFDLAWNIERDKLLRKQHDLGSHGGCMHKIRRLHLYLGCFFAPMLVLLALSGTWQTWGFGAGTKAKVPESLRSAYDFAMSGSGFHRHVRSATTHEPGTFSEFRPFELKGKDLYNMPYSVFLTVLGLGLVVTTMLGVVMAFKFLRNPVLVSVILVSGILLPIILAWWKEMQFGPP
jgi:hypothetical protein